MSSDGTALGDFAFFRLEITGGRLVSGFGGDINLTTRTLSSLLAVGTPVGGDFPTNGAVAQARP